MENAVFPSESKKRTYVYLPPPPISTSFCFFFSLSFFFFSSLIFFFPVNFSLSSLITPPRPRRTPPRPRHRGPGAAPGWAAGAGRESGKGCAEQGCKEKSLLVVPGKQSYHVWFLASTCHFVLFHPYQCRLRSRCTPGGRRAPLYVYRGICTPIDEPDFLLTYNLPQNL